MTRAVIATLVLAAVACPALAADAKKAKPVKPRIEVVFVLDTTGSMSGLIQAAKEKIWAIANTLATTRPAPDIKMGLIGFRDRGDAYVTKLTALTDDLDAVYKELMAFKAGGGGDGPESVNQALHEAVTKIAWSKGRKTYRVIFLVGDSPPHMDYTDDVKYQVTCETAAKAGVVINTIQCGGNRSTTPIWRDIASLAEGRYFQVNQSGSAVLASTPFDKDLAELAKKLDATRVYYGAADVVKWNNDRMKVADGIYKDASISAQAQRALFNAREAGATNWLGRQELVDDIANDRVELAKVKEEHLPESMRKMSVAEREAFVKKNLDERTVIRAKIKVVAAKRQEHIKKQLGEAGGAGSLDKGIFDCIKTQAAKRDIKYDGGPSL